MPFKKGEIPEGATPFKPGESGNPVGRPSGVENSKTRLLRWLSHELDVTNPATKQKERGTLLEMMDAALIQKALKGNVNAYRELLDRFEGKVLQKAEFKHKGVIETKPDLSELSDADLDTLESILVKIEKNS